MDWNNKIIFRNSLISSTNLLHNNSCNQFDHFPDMEVRNNENGGVERDMIMMGFGNQEKMKRRLTTNQLESLESSFEEERKLDPDRKMKLARDLALQPRQVAVWFQNRRARWKAKKLQHLYDALKLDFELVSKEKHKLQQEVERLKSIMVMEEATKKQVYSSYTEASCEETVESTSAAAAAAAANQYTGRNSGSNNGADDIVLNREHNKTAHHCLFNLDNYNAISPSYWGGLPFND